MVEQAQKGNTDFTKGVKEEEEHKGGVVDWFKSTICGGGEDRDYKKVAITAGFGIAGGTTGGILANRSVANDQEIITYESSQVPKAEYYEMPELGKGLSRNDMRILGQFVDANTGNAADKAVDMRYLTYLASSNPEESPVAFGQIYEGVKLHSASPEEARQAMQVITAMLQKNPGAPPQQIYMEYLTRVNQTGSPAEAIKDFKADFNIKDSDYAETIMSLKTEHSSPLWKLGRTGATAAGIAVGSLIGVGLGAIVATIMKLIGEKGEK
jgi:hypothetical protein